MTDICLAENNVISLAQNIVSEIAKIRGKQIMLGAFLLSSFERLAANVASKDDAGNKQPDTQPDAAPNPVPQEELSERERYLQALQRAMEHNGFRF